MKKLYDVVPVGSALKDIIFYTNGGKISKRGGVEYLTLAFDKKLRSDRVHFGFGGGAANTATNFKGLGLNVAPMLTIGADEDGDNILNFFKKRKIDTALVRRHPSKHTGFSLLLIHEKNHNHVALSHYGAAAQIIQTAKDVAKINTQWWYVSSLNGPTWKRTLGGIIKSSGKLAWNPGGYQLAEGYAGMKRFLEKTDVLLLNKQEAGELVRSHPSYHRKTTFTGIPGGRRLACILRDLGPRIVVITDGQKGVFAVEGDAVYNKKPPKDSPVDTTGAGDSFGSTVVAVLHKTDDLEKALKAAQVNTTSVVHKVGAQAGFLRWSELKKRAKI